MFMLVCSFTVIELKLRISTEKSKICIGFRAVLFNLLFHFKSCLIVRIAMEGVVKFVLSFISSDKQDYSFSVPYCKFVEI